MKVNATGLVRAVLEPIPANVLFGLRVICAEDGYAEVCVDVKPEFTNVIGSLHASGLIALADGAGLAALMSIAENAEQTHGVIPLGAAAGLHFRAPATGTITAKCTLSRAAVLSAGNLFAGTSERVRLSTQADLTDAGGKLVCTGKFQWSVSRGRSAGERD